MLIRRLIVTSVALLCAVWSHAAAWLWPVEGRPAGENILYRPQSHIGDELNFATLFIGAPEGSAIVAPADGTILHISINYLQRLNYMTGGGLSPDDDPDRKTADLAEKLGAKAAPEYIHGSIMIRLDDGRKLHLAGLRFDRIFKTGEKVARGERLGTSTRVYRKIAEPHISVSVSDRRSRSADPMSDFGLRTTFIAPEELKPITELTRAEAAEDFNLLLDAFIECFPALDELVARDSLERYRSDALASLPDPVPYKEFRNLMRRTAALLHDSHVTLYRDEQAAPVRSLELNELDFGSVGGRVVVTRTVQKYTDYYGREITAVDGIPADEIVRRARREVTGYDGAVESVADYIAALGLTEYYYAYFAPGARSCTLTFADGTQLVDKRWTYRGGPSGLTPDWGPAFRTNHYPDANFSARMLDDSTAYLGLSTFSLNRVEIDSVRAFIARNTATPHLIVDVRNNGGGDVTVLRRILSYLSDKPYRATGGYTMVNKRGGFATLEHSLNYAGVEEIFPEYEAVEGGEGYYDFGQTHEAILPDSLVRYGGRLYVLADQNSASAATEFPGAVMRSHRGLVIGRETASAYRFLTAIKFADLMLPHSRTKWRIPLVRCVFDETESPRIPHGRGVLPDIEVPLTLDEIASTNGDAILNRALRAIAEGEYLGEDPFAAIDSPDPQPHAAWWIAGAVLLLLSGGGLLLRRRR